MSKIQPDALWDGREAFHRATMAVYADLGVLIDVLKREPNLRVALLALDRIVEHRAPEPGDSPLIANLKHAVGHLRESQNTVEDVLKKNHQIGSAFWRGRGIERMWGEITSGSYHEVALGAAEAMLEPDAAGAAQCGRKASPGGKSGIIREKVIEAANDPVSWARLAENLEHEFRSASILPHAPSNEPKPPTAVPAPNDQGDASEAADDRQLVGWARILPELGFEACNRQKRDLVKKLNQSTNGPIKRNGRRGVIVNRGRLMAWWRDADRRAAAAADNRAKMDCESRALDDHLSNPGVRRGVGFHDRENPNKRKRKT